MSEEKKKTVRKLCFIPVSYFTFKNSSKWIKILTWHNLTIKLLEGKGKYFNILKVNKQVYAWVFLTRKNICNTYDKNEFLILNTSYKWKRRDFPGGPVAKTPGSQCKGPGLDLWSGS